MKLLTVFLCSFCLLHWQLASTTAMADDNTPSRTRQTQVIEENPDLQVDATAVGVAESIFSTLAVFTMAMTSPVFVASCPKGFDAWILMLIGLAYIGVEIYMLSAFKETSTQEFKIFSGAKDKQLKSFQLAMTRTQELMNAINVRMGFQFAIAAMLLVMSVICFIIYTAITVGSWGSKAATAFACVAQNDTKDRDDFYYAKNNLTPPDPLDGVHLKSTFTQIKQAIQHSPDDMHSYFLMKEQYQLTQGAIKSEDYQISEKGLDFVNLSMGNSLKDYIGLIANSAEKLGDTFIPSSYAKDEGLSSADTMRVATTATKLGLSSLAAIIGSVAAIIFAVKQVGQINGLVRGIVWIVLSAFAFTAAGLTKAQQDKFQSYYNKYKKLHTRLSKLKGPQDEGPTVGNQQFQRTWQPPSLDPGNPTLVSIQNTTCKGGSGIFKRSSACSCKKRDCKVKATKIDYSKLGNFGQMVAGAHRMGTSAGNNVLGGNMAGAMVDANNLGRNAAAYKKASDKTKVMLNNALKKVGEKAVNFNSLEKQMKDNMLASFQKKWDKLSPAQRNAATDWLSGNTPPDAETDEEPTIIPGGQAGQGGQKRSATTTKPAPEKKAGSLFDFLNDGDDDDGGKDGKSSFAAEKDRLNEMKKRGIEGEDVSKDAGKSLFKIIETRYMKFAYPILLDN